MSSANSLPQVVNPITVQVYWSPAPRAIRSIALTLPAGATVLQALELAEQFVQAGDRLPTDTTFAIWSRKASSSTVLRDGDRLELLRPLTVDPKIARQRRFDKQGKRGTGLFRLAKTKSV